MAWILYSFENELSITDFHNGKFVLSIEHFLPERPVNGSFSSELQFSPAASFFPSSGIGEVGVESISKEDVQRYFEHCKKLPFEGMDRSFVFYKDSPFNLKNYDLVLNKNAGLVRKIWTIVPEGSRLTHQIYKCAGRGDTNDFLSFADYVSSRLPKLSEEIINPIQREMPEYIRRRIEYAGNIDWKLLQKEINADLYRMFEHSVQYSAVEPAPPFRIDGGKAKSMLQKLAHFKN